MSNLGFKTKDLFRHEVEGVFLDLLNQEILSEEELETLRIEAKDLLIEAKDRDFDNDTNLKLGCLKYYLNPQNKDIDLIWTNIYTSAKQNNLNEVMHFVTDVIKMEV